MKSMMLYAAIAMMVGVAVGCTRRAQEPPPPPPSPQTARVTITERDWNLVQLGDTRDPRGAGGRPVTLRFESVASRATGFSGCNRYNGLYALNGDSLTFEPPVSTRMACAEGTELENRYLGSLPSVRTYQATDSTLTLVGSEGPIARFRAVPDTLGR